MRSIIRFDRIRVGRGKIRPGCREISVIDIEGQGWSYRDPEAGDRLISEHGNGVVCTAEHVAEVARNLGDADAAANMRGYRPPEAEIIDPIGHFADSMALGVGVAPRPVRWKYHLEVRAIVAAVGEIALETPRSRLIADASPGIEAVKEGLVRHRLSPGERGERTRRRNRRCSSPC